jgi:RNA polymerase sigma-70 factor (ECF subfamily)
LDKHEQKQLLRKCISGKREAHKKLYDTFAEDMFKVCCMYAPDADTANDFLQEGFLKVFQNLHKYKPSGSLGGWIRRVMVHNCIDLIRRDHWTRVMIPFEDSPAITEPSFVENDFERNLNSRSFFDIVRELPLGYRTVLNLFYMEEYTHKEIAQKLEITEGTSKSQLAKAKNYLRQKVLKSLTTEEIEFYVGRLVKEVV